MKSGLIGKSFQFKMLVNNVGKCSKYDDIMFVPHSRHLVWYIRDALQETVVGFFQILRDNK